MRPFFIWFQHRSGSTHLVSLLNSHTDIDCRGEMFGCFPVEDAKLVAENANVRAFGEQFYRRIINQFPGRIEDPTDEYCCNELEDFFFVGSSTNETRVRGFKLKFPSQAKVFPEVSKRLLQAANDVNLVVLNRKDYLRRAISVLNLTHLQSKTGKANVSENINLPPTSFEPGEVVRLIKYYESIQEEFDGWARNFPNRFELDYEDLQASEQSKLKELLQFLGVVPKQLKSTTKKITPDKLESYVTNLEEILLAVRQSSK